MVRAALLILLVLLPEIRVAADMVIVSQTLTCENDNLSDPCGPFFIARDYTLDHPPYYRDMWDDWGWTHNMKGLVPSDANGIASATLTIRTWDVDGDDPNRPEVDAIYAIRTTQSASLQTACFQHRDPATGSPVTFALPATPLGSLQVTNMYFWGSTSLSLPADVLSDLWQDGKLGIFMNIDARAFGRRVMLGYSTLTVAYVTPHAAWEPNMPVYRFWSPLLQEYFFTADELEKTKLITLYPPSIWTYEDVAYHTYPDKRDGSVSPVYRFWAPRMASHFYTIREGEKDKLMAKDDPNFVAGIPSTWVYEGIAFYAHAEGHQPQGAMPVYRFWSASLCRHFFTTSEAERQECIDRPSIWCNEGIAWYVHDPSHVEGENTR